MKKDIKLKTQFFLKKTYTYKYFKFFKKLNVVFLKNSFHFFHFFKSLSFSYFLKFLLYKNVKTSSLNIFLNKDQQLTLFKKSYHSKVYDDLYSNNYISWGCSVLDKKNLTYKSINHNTVVYRKRLINQIYIVWNNLHKHPLTLNSHFMIVTAKNGVKSHWVGLPKHY
jgi:hypothetical protein